MRRHISTGLLLAGMSMLLLVGHETPAQQGGGAMAQGVYVDADGVLRTVMVGESGDGLRRLRRQNVARATGQISGKAPLRRVSLAGVAKEVSARIAAGQPVPDELRYLAGITQIQYLFVYPEERDLVIAGPAEGWEMDVAGRVVGQSSKRPVLRLDDLVVVLRVFPPGGNPREIVGCTINQTPEGVRNLNQFLKSLGPSVDPRQINASLVQRVRDSLGMQDIEVWGVPADSRLGLVLVEADYRMKLIGIGLEDPRVRGLTSYYSMLGAGDGGMNKLQHWWFVPDYEAIVESPDGDAFEFRGQRAKLVGADKRLGATGQVDSSTSTSATTRRYAQSFSAHFEALARINPVYADMQNAFDWVIIAALIQQRDFIRQAAPDLGYFLENEGGYVPERLPVPRQVESVVNAKWIGNKLAVPVGGGVVVKPSTWIGRESAKATADSKLRARHQAARMGAARGIGWWAD